MTFAEASGAGWGNITHFALFDDIAAGNFLGSGELSEAEDVVAGKTIQFDVGHLTITLD